MKILLHSKKNVKKKQIADKEIISFGRDRKNGLFLDFLSEI